MGLIFRSIAYNKRTIEDQQNSKIVPQLEVLYTFIHCLLIRATIRPLSKFGLSWLSHGGFQFERKAANRSDLARKNSFSDDLTGRPAVVETYSSIKSWMEHSTITFMFPQALLHRCPRSPGRKIKRNINKEHETSLLSVSTWRNQRLLRGCTIQCFHGSYEKLHCHRHIARCNNDFRFTLDRLLKSVNVR